MDTLIFFVIAGILLIGFEIDRVVRTGKRTNELLEGIKDVLEEMKDEYERSQLLIERS